MNSQKVNAIGLMSGTSLDGLDIVYVQFNKSEIKSFDIIFSETIPYNNKWKSNLMNSINKSKEELISLDLKYGIYLGKKINLFINSKKIKNVDFIASHGHTVLHQPNKGITLQIGSGKKIAEITGCKVVCDFRTQDVKLGGQGAPLVPIGDELLFSKYDACINLGGFANISYKTKNKRIAFDICPVNIVLNYYVFKLGFEFDDEGKIASTGKINNKLLEKLNALDFYKKMSPKSLGLEWVREYVRPLINESSIEINDILRTFIEHIAIQISVVINDSKSVLVTGGGAFNKFLIQRINHFTNSEIIIPNNQIVNYKEALIFTLLGMLKLDNQINCLSSVTGASKNHSSGEVFMLKK